MEQESWLKQARLLPELNRCRKKLLAERYKD